MSNDKVRKAYQACSGCNSELTLAQYKQLLKEIELEEMAKLDKELSNTETTTKTTKK